MQFVFLLLVSIAVFWMYYFLFFFFDNWQVSHWVINFDITKISLINNKLKKTVFTFLFRGMYMYDRCVTLEIDVQLTTCQPVEMQWISAVRVALLCICVCVCVCVCLCLCVFVCRGTLSPLIVYSPLLYADGGVGELSTKYFWSFRGKQRCSQVQYNLSKWWPIPQTYKNNWILKTIILLRWCRHPVGQSRCMISSSVSKSDWWHSLSGLSKF